MKKVFLITRFNLKLWTRDKSNNKTLSEKWLDERFILFEKYCLPSVKAQTFKDFCWICLFADETPVKYKERISQYKDQIPQFIPCYIVEKETKDFIFYLKEVIGHYITNMTDVVIQIRLDNDDALHKNYLKKIVALSDEQSSDLMIYSFKHGYQYYCNMNLAIKIPYPNNHFLAIINKDYSSLNVNILEFNHYQVIKEKRPFTCIENKTPMWLEVIHDSNVDNDVKMTLKQHFSSQKKLDDFGIKNIRLDNRLVTRIEFIFRAIKQILIHIRKRIIHK